MKPIFLAWCHVAAAVAYELGWRVTHNRDVTRRTDELLDLVLFFVGGGELSSDESRFAMRRAMADAQRLWTRIEGEEGRMSVIHPDYRGEPVHLWCGRAHVECCGSGPQRVCGPEVNDQCRLAPRWVTNRPARVTCKACRNSWDNRVASKL